MSSSFLSETQSYYLALSDYGSGIYNANFTFIAYFLEIDKGAAPSIKDRTRAAPCIDLYFSYTLNRYPTPQIVSIY